MGSDEEVFLSGCFLVFANMKKLKEIREHLLNTPDVKFIFHTFSSDRLFVVRKKVLEEAIATGRMDRLKEIYEKRREK